MARYDKYDPYDGGFRAPLLNAITLENGFVMYAVGLNASGQVVLGAGNTGVIGVLIAHGAREAGEQVDVMTDGEIVEVTGLVAGTRYYGVAADGTITATVGTNKPLGYTVEASRLIVRVGV